MKLGILQKVFSKIVAQITKQEQVKLEKDLILLEEKLNTLEYIENYNVPKYLWENIYEHITKGIKADVNVMKKVKNLQSFFLISKKHRLEKVLLKC